MTEKFEPQIFTEPAIQRLEQFLLARFGKPTAQKIVPLTPDASTREYFRIAWDKKTAIACVYPETFSPKNFPYLDVTNLFLASGLPVAEILETNGSLGIIIHEDFGDRILRPILAAATDDERETLINQAIKLIARIQAATEQAFALDSIASRLAFDFEKLSWELDFFFKHYFESYRGEILQTADTTNLKNELNEVAQMLAMRPRVLCHRDFHAANLMLDDENRLRIIDHQDARMGPASYDLVSLLLDRIIEPPSRVWLREKRMRFLEERRMLGLSPIDPDDFAAEFRLMTIQRCLKAIGTFSFQTGVRKRPGYVQYIEPMFRVVLRAVESLNSFPHLQRIIRERLQ
ncbi:MAG: phosphotransferase [Acidobacteriota bacterium]|nr:phosphotransferase [Acidobacteriota bacterium]